MSATTDPAPAGRGARGPATPASPAPSGASRGRLAGWVVLAVVLVAALVVGVTDDGGPRTLGERARDVASSVACPQCDGQSAADSDASAARGVRSYIEERLAAGASDDEIRDELAGSYGEQILLTPERSGIEGLVWVLPVVGLVLAFGGLALAFRRWRGRGVTRASAADRALVGEALAGTRPAVPGAADAGAEAGGDAGDAEAEAGGDAGDEGP